MACTGEQYKAVFSVARANPGTRVVVQHSSSSTILLHNPKKNKSWVINSKGKVRRVVPVG